MSKSRSDLISKKLGDLLLQGYRMLNATCSKCDVGYIFEYFVNKKHIHVLIMYFSVFWCNAKTNQFTASAAKMKVLMIFKLKLFGIIFHLVFILELNEPAKQEANKYDNSTLQDVAPQVYNILI